MGTSVTPTQEEVKEEIDGETGEVKKREKEKRIKSHPCLLVK